MRLHDAFMLDAGVTYLNNGAFGATPRAVLAAQRRWQDALERQPVAFQEEARFMALEEALRRVGAFVGATPGQLAFVNNATVAVNAVVASVPLSAGDEVVTLDLAYPAVLHTLQVWCRRRGATLVKPVVPLPLAGPEQVLDVLGAALGPRTRLAVLDHIASSSGLVLPLSDMVALCHARGVPVLVDGAHAPGQVDLHVEEIGAEWYTGNLHKWAFAPKGCGFLYAAPGHEAIEPPVISWVAPNWREALHWQGTNDPSTWLASTAGLDFLDSLGPAGVRADNRTLANAGAALLADAGCARPFPAAMHAAMVTLELPGAFTQASADDVHRRLRREHRIEVPVQAHRGRGWMRISAQVYNTLDDYERLSAALAR